jgi:hypothetical protein
MIFDDCHSVREIDIFHAYTGGNTMAKSYRHAKVNGVGMLTTNSKTGCPSWAISQRSCTGAAGCSLCKKCYGNKGRFALPDVRNALEKRHEWFNQSSESDVVSKFMDELSYFGHPYFRSHVVGDFENARSIRIWNEIAAKAEGVRFWFPTKAYRVSGLLHGLRKLNALPNVTIRPSSADFDVDAPEVKGLAAGATAHKNSGPRAGHFECPGECESCRVCWDKPDVKVTYHFH